MNYSNNVRLFLIGIIATTVVSFAMAAPNNEPKIAIKYGEKLKIWSENAQKNLSFNVIIRDESGKEIQNKNLSYGDTVTLYNPDNKKYLSREWGWKCDWRNFKDNWQQWIIQNKDQKGSGLVYENDTIILKTKTDKWYLKVGKNGDLWHGDDKQQERPIHFSLVDKVQAKEQKSAEPSKSSNETKIAIKYGDKLQIYSENAQKNLSFSAFIRDESGKEIQNKNLSYGDTVTLYNPDNKKYLSREWGWKCGWQNFKDNWQQWIIQNKDQKGSGIVYEGDSLILKTKTDKWYLKVGKNGDLWHGDDKQQERPIRFSLVDKVQVKEQKSTEPSKVTAAVIVQEIKTITKESAEKAFKSNDSYSYEEKSIDKSNAPLKESAKKALSDVAVDKEESANQEVESIVESTDEDLAALQASAEKALSEGSVEEAEATTQEVESIDEDLAALEAAADKALSEGSVEEVAIESTNEEI